MLGVLGVAVPHVAMADNASCITDDNQQGVYVAIAVNGKHCFPINSTKLQDNAIFLYITAILKVVSGLAGIATLGGIVWAAVLFVTARANASQVEKARLIMVNSILGLLLFIFMYAILQYLVPGGLFS